MDHNPYSTLSSSFKCRKECLARNRRVHAAHSSICILERFLNLYSHFVSFQSRINFHCRTSMLVKIVELSDQHALINTPVYRDTQLSLLFTEEEWLDEEELSRDCVANNLSLSMTLYSYKFLRFF